MQVCKITPYSSCNYRQNYRHLLCRDKGILLYQFTYFLLSISELHYRQTYDITYDITGDIRLLRSQIVTSKMQVLYSHTVLWSHLASGSASIILYCICSCVYSCIYSCKSHLITKCDRSHSQMKRSTFPVRSPLTRERDNKNRKADNLIREISQQNQYNKQ